MPPHVPAYTGSDPFAFVSYSHLDSEVVTDDISWLGNSGCNVWYDEGIRPGGKWVDELASALDNCGLVLFYVSNQSVASSHCFDEISYALDSGKPLLAVHLEPTQLPGGIRLAIGTRQAIFRYEFSLEVYRERLRAAIDALLRGEPDTATGGLVQPHRPWVPQKQSYWRMPLRRNPHFTGREALFAQIEAFWRSPAPVHLLALVGLGGVGKSQLAMELAYRTADQYELCAWVRAEDEGTFLADICDIAGELGLPEAGGTLQMPIVEAVASWLSSHDSWMLIFDNVDDADLVLDFVPDGSKGHVVLTTRHQLTGADVFALDVAVLTNDESNQFLLNRTGDGNRSAVRKLADELGHLPLALEEAVSYMAATGRSCESYVSLFRKHRRRLLSRSEGPKDYSSNLLGTWDISVAEIERVSPEVVEVFRLLAMFGPEDIPLGLLAEGLAQSNDRLSPLARDELEWDDAIAILRRYSLIRIDGDSASLHRLVQLISREKSDDLDQLAERALRLVERIFPQKGLDGDLQTTTSRLLPHALVVLDHAGSLASCELLSARLLNRTGTYLSTRGSYLAGKEHLSRALDIYEGRGDDEIDMAVRARVYLAQVEYGMGDSESALRNFQMVMATHEDQLGRSQIHVAQDLVDIAWVLRTEGEFDDALNAALEAVDICDRHPNDRTLLKAMALCIASRSAWDSNRLDDSIGLAMDALREIDRPQDMYHPYLAGALYHLGQVLLDAGDLRTSKRCATVSLAFSTATYGDSHIFVAFARGLVGSIHAKLGESDDAARQFEESLTIGKRTCLSLHEDVTIKRAELAGIYIDVGRQDVAEEQLRLNLEELGNTCGERRKAESLQHLQRARLLQKKGDLDMAENACQNALALLADAFGGNHPSLALPLRVLGGIYESKGASAAAASQLAGAEAIEGRFELGGAEQSHVLQHLASQYLDDPSQDDA